MRWFVQQFLPAYQLPFKLEENISGNNISATVCGTARAPPGEASDSTQSVGSWDWHLASFKVSHIFTASDFVDRFDSVVGFSLWGRHTTFHFHSSTNLLESALSGVYFWLVRPETRAHCLPFQGVAGGTCHTEVSLPCLELPYLVFFVTSTTWLGDSGRW